MLHYYQLTKVHFGIGQLSELGHICRGYGKTCFLVITPDASPQPLYERMKKLLDAEGISVIYFDKVEPNPSVEIAGQGSAMLREQPADFALAIGSGSSIDIAKAITFANGREPINWDHLFSECGSPFAHYPSYSEKYLPLLSVPITSGAGSQVVQAAVITRGKEKITFFHPDNFSQGTVLDLQLILTLLKHMDAATDFDALTHTLEDYISVNASPYNAMDPMKVMQLMIGHLPHVLEDPQNLEFRTDTYPADTLAGYTLASFDTSAPRPLSEIIGGIVRLPYGKALAVALPAFIQHMADKNRECFADVAELFSSDDLYTAMIEFLETIGLYRKLKDLGVNEEDLQEILVSPVLDHLPFGGREELEAILKNSYA